MKMLKIVHVLSIRVYNGLYALSASMQQAYLKIPCLSFSSAQWANYTKYVRSTYVCFPKLFSLTAILNNELYEITGKCPKEYDLQKVHVEACAKPKY